MFTRAGGDGQAKRTAVAAGIRESGRWRCHSEEPDGASWAVEAAFGATEARHRSVEAAFRAEERVLQREGSGVRRGVRRSEGRLRLPADLRDPPGHSPRSPQRSARSPRRRDHRRPRVPAERAPSREARGKVAAILAFLAACGIAVSNAVLARIEACNDAATLDLWITRAATAASAEEVIASPASSSARNPATRHTSTRAAHSIADPRAIP